MQRPIVVMARYSAGYLILLAAVLAIAQSALAQTPAIGAGARFQVEKLGPGWHRGFVNQFRTAPPCYIVMVFQRRSSSKQPLRVAHTIPITSVKRLQVTNAPGTSMQEWQGLAMASVPEESWREIALSELKQTQGHCSFD